MKITHVFILSILSGILQKGEGIRTEVTQYIEKIKSSQKYLFCEIKISVSVKSAGKKKNTNVF